ncbi:response regulator [Magnetospira sp. QH-2]|uniref:response regulator n=1 Tax=Magnetospira sp. (strain QH-2) TaxID=1288970 RepID=UPI0005F9E599|nr:response regulator [Magnetospira sp. QH-2]
MNGKQDLSKVSVLLVEDEAFMRRLIQRMLEDLGVGEIVLAQDGGEAVQYILNNSYAFTLILLDLEMPRVNGFEVLKYLRSAPDVGNHDLPVVILTGHAEKERVVQAVQYGIHGYLVKPVSKADLISKINRAMTKPPIDASHLK